MRNERIVLFGAELPIVMYFSDLLMEVRWYFLAETAVYILSSYGLNFDVQIQTDIRLRKREIVALLA